MVLPEVKVRLVSLDPRDLLVPPELKEGWALLDPLACKVQLETPAHLGNQGLPDPRALWDLRGKLDYRDFLYVTCNVM